MDRRQFFSKLHVGDAFRLRKRGVIYIKHSYYGAWRLTGKRRAKGRGFDPNHVVDQIVGKVVDVVLEL